MAPLIVDEVGDHKVWWEPFCGSLAVTLAKPPCLMETVNDLHGELVNLARFRRARVVVSYYAHPDLARLYPGWSAREIEVTKALVSQGMRGREGATKATEVLLVNGPLRGGRGADLFPIH